MRKIVLLVFLVILVRAGWAQVFTVVKVSGTVESPFLKRKLQTGDKIEEKDKLKFEGKEAYIIVTSAKTGNKKIAGVPDAAPREFMQLLHSFIKPGKKSTASRSFDSNYIESLRGTMHGDTLLILGDGLINVNTAKLSLTPPHAISVFYLLNGQKVQRKISSATNFCLASNCIFADPAPAVMPKIQIYFMEDEQADFPENLLGSFVPIYTNENELLKEIKALAEFVRTEKTGNSLYAEIKTYIAGEYGGSQDANLKAWLSVHGVIPEN